MGLVMGCSLIWRSIRVTELALAREVFGLTFVRVYRVRWR